MAPELHLRFEGVDLGCSYPGKHRKSMMNLEALQDTWVYNINIINIVD